MPATTIHTLPKRPIAVSSLKWQPLDIAVGATLGAACGVIFWGFNFAYMPISSVFGAILPGFRQHRARRLVLLRYAGGADSAQTRSGAVREPYRHAGRNGDW